MSLVAAMLAVGALAVGIAYLYSDRPPEPPPPFEVSPVAFTDLTLAPGVHPLTVHIRNPANVPRRILGFKTGCTEIYCTGAGYAEPITVPAGGEFDFQFLVQVQAAGPIDGGIELYLEDNGVRQVLVTIKGTALGPGDAPKPTK
jgi:hypothetical protein